MRIRATVRALLVVALLLAGCSGGAGDTRELVERHNATVDDVLAATAADLEAGPDVTAVATTATDEPPARSARSDIGVLVTTDGLDEAGLEALVRDVAERLWGDAELLLVDSLSVVGEDTGTGATTNLGRVLLGEDATPVASDLEEAFGPRP